MNALAIVYAQGELVIQKSLFEIQATRSCGEPPIRLKIADFDSQKDA